MAAISIHWSGLLHVAEVAFAFGVGIVTVFALGVLGMSRVSADSRQGLARVGDLALAGVAFAACAAATLYGLYLMIPQFHN
jgi:hypothetical protein